MTRRPEKYLLVISGNLAVARILSILVSVISLPCTVTLSIRKAFYKKIGSFFSGFEVLPTKLLLLLECSEGSNPLSIIFRRWFEHQSIRTIFGFNLIILILMFGIGGNAVGATFSSYADIDSQLDNRDISVVELPKEAVVTTERRFQMPVNLIGISQGFHKYHPGVDLMAEYGSGIKPIAEGIVAEVYRSKYGYGQSLLIDHQDGYSSMYAHVQKITVESGLSVDKSTVIAEVGLTGYTTGPHLHLEIYNDGTAINPQPLIAY